MLNHLVVVVILSQFNMYKQENFLKNLNFPLFNITQKNNSYKLTGSDSISFLDRISTNKIEIFDQKTSSKTILTDNKGSIIDILNYKVLDNNNIIFSLESNNPQTIDYLKKLIIVEDVEIFEDNPIKKITIYSRKEIIAEKNLFSFSFYNIDKLEDMIRYEIYFKGNFNITNLSLEEFEKISETTKKRIDIQNNLFEFDTKLKKINPLETGLIDYISFNKGCYVGQEVIARLHNYKKISREIIKFQSSENMIINAPFKSQDNISGKILSITKDKTEFVGLCLIKKKDVGKISSDFLLI